MINALQILTALLCNVAILNFGLQAGWLAPLQPAFQSNNSSPLGEEAQPLSDEQISWIGSLPSMEFIVTAPIFGYALDKIGRKKCLFLTTAPNVITYLLLIFANNVNIVYLARIVGGFCCSGAFIVGPIYVNETAHSSLKGTLCGLTGFFVKLGIILSFVFGAYTSYITLNLMCLSSTLLFLIGYSFIPESPVYLVKKGRLLEAEAAYMKLWKNVDKKSISEEIALVQNTLVHTHKEKKVCSQLKDLILKRELRTGMIFVGGIYTFQMFSGYPAIVRYAVDIFSDAGSSMSPYNAAILLGVAQLAFSFIGALLIDSLGRKTLLKHCLMLMAISLGVLSIYLYMRIFSTISIIGKFTFMPICALTIFISCYATGFGTVPFVVTPELFSPDTRALASTSTNIWCAVAEFIVVKSFPSITNMIHLSGSIGLFSVFSVIGTIFLYCYTFETNGLDFETIRKKLSGEKVYKIVPQEKCETKDKNENV